MKIESISCPFVKYSLPNHKEIKEKLLYLINSAEYDSPKVDTADVDITKADWYNSSNLSRPWTNFFLENSIDHIIKMYNELGFDGFKLNEIWFQQYEKNSRHGWHTHSSNFTNVYYLEMEEDSPKTQIINPMNLKEVIEIDAQEGDMIFFPSFILHRAPINKKNKRKTIISYNIDPTYSDNIYDWEI